MNTWSSKSTLLLEQTYEKYIFFSDLIRGSSHSTTKLVLLGPWERPLILSAHTILIHAEVGKKMEEESHPHALLSCVCCLTKKKKSKSCDVSVIF